MQNLDSSHNRITLPPINNRCSPTEGPSNPVITCPWHSSLALPKTKNGAEACDDTGVIEEELNFVRTMVDRINVRWRYFLVQPGLMQIMVPEIAEKLQQVSRYLDDTVSRFESTRIFLKTVILEGPDSVKGNEIVSRINAVHSHIGINPESQAFTFVLYTLSTQFIRSIRMNSAIAPSDREEEALFKVLRRVGIKMGASNIPEEYSNFVSQNEKFLQEIEVEKKDTSQSVAKQLIEKGVAPFSPWYRPFARHLGLSFVEPHVLDHLGIMPPPLAVRRCVRKLCQIITSQPVRN